MTKFLKTTKILLAVLPLFAFLSSCEKTEQPIKIRVNQFKQTAVAVGPIMTLSIQQNSQIGSENWTPLYDDIIGFEYDPGYIYDLLVTEVEILNPQADGNQKGFQLKQILSKTKVASKDNFTLDLKLNETIFVKGNLNAGYNILEQVQIDCGNLCNEFNNLLQSNAVNIRGKFTLNDNGSIKLIELTTN